MHRLATRIRARRKFWLPDIAHWCALDAAAGHRDGQAASLRVALHVRNASVHGEQIRHLKLFVKPRS